MKHNQALLLMITGLFSHIASYFTTEQIGITANYLAVIATGMAIIYYTDIFIKWMINKIKGTSDKKG